MPETEVHRALIMKAVDPTCTGDAQFQRLWAREFRYDGPRQRYLERALDPVTLAQPWETSGDVWTDYIGDTAVLDYRFDSTWPNDETRLAGYLPGVSQTDLAGLATQYMHGDHLGSTWFMTDEQSPVTSSRRAVRTAFGEHVSLESGPATRHGYAGAWGYQEHDYDANGAGDGLPDAWYDANGMGDGFPYLHVGWRYYDPASGRFLQRDPIGIEAGLNVYAYVDSAPTVAVDPEGLCIYCDMEKPRPAPKDGSKGAWLGVAAGQLWCHLVRNAPEYNRKTKPKPKHKPKPRPKRRRVPGPPAPGLCFVGGTQVLTPGGPVPIEEIELGTIVATHDGPCGDAVERPVIRVIHGEATDLVTITFGTESVTCTRGHPFYVVDTGWIEAGDLHEGDLVPTEKGELEEISGVSTRTLAKPIRVYNFQVEQNHYYFVGEGQFLVHNGKM